MFGSIASHIPPRSTKFSSATQACRRLLHDACSPAGRFIPLTAADVELQLATEGFLGVANATAHILSVDPNYSLRVARKEGFEGAGYAVTSLPSTFDALRKLSGISDAFDIVVVCDSTGNRFRKGTDFPRPA